jgi:hypothetical protein
MTPKGEIPGAVKSSLYILNMALRDAQRQGFDVEITERQGTYGARPMLTLDVAVHERGEVYGDTAGGVHSGVSG